MPVPRPACGSNERHRLTAGAPEVARIDALLPQTQCTRCGYSGCLPYAHAIAGGEADINQCPPGGSATIRALADLLGRDYRPLNPAHGVESPPRRAWIDEARCIGCARCLPPCPVDAIVGAAKYVHTVLSDRCTGCELCLAPCPVDCIEMRPAPARENAPAPSTESAPAWAPKSALAPSTDSAPESAPHSAPESTLHPALHPAPESAPGPACGQAALNRERYQAHAARLQRRAEERRRQLAALKAAAPRSAPTAS